MPVAKQLLSRLAEQPIQVVMDGSVVGRGCIALMLSAVYHGRALPLCWLVLRGVKGHFPHSVHQELLSQIHAIMGPGASVTFLGDAEFDGTALQAELRRREWHYVRRTASNILVSACGVSFRVGDLGQRRGEQVAVGPAYMTAEQYGPISILAIRESQYQEPLYLVTNMTDLDTVVKFGDKVYHKS